VTECKCRIERRTKRLLAKSGLENVIDNYTFDKYIVNDGWQQHIKQTALKYAANPVNWFFIGGQVGAGKSHICTAIVGELLKRGIACLYMLWRDEAVRLKSVVTDEFEYQTGINKLKQIDCLYIDDFFKTERGKMPTSADINIAFELLNYRYNKQLPTLISSEKTIGELLDIDEAVGSRIFQMTKDSCLEIAADKSKNIRLRI
jgi:DNA replication protein DnaC